SSWLASVSTLPKVTSGCSSEVASKIGPKRLHGPHHSAQKSSRTMPSLPTVSWKFSPVISFVAMCFPFRFTRCVFPPGVSARRGEYSSFLSAPCNVGCSLLYSTVGAQNMSYFVFYEHSERI